ncbi:MAG: carbon-nitrogen hydrolase family protein [Bacteroidia bacterium]|nr:carbon-nitrogen hydrolase family protein [Bacteroidia bacterium]
MPHPYNILRACVIQDSPVFFDKAATLEKVKKLVDQHSTNCDLMLFPESFIPAYPRGFDFGAKVGSRSMEGRELYHTYWRESFELGTEDEEQLSEIARLASIFLVIGVTERTAKNGSLYCSMLYFNPEGKLMGVHRKIKPTGTERLIWAEAGAESLVSFQTPYGIMGGLICWENYMPLARMAMYKQGVQLYMAPTADSRTAWTASMQHIALEGRCFVLAANQFISKSEYPEKYQKFVKEEDEILCRGGSLIVSPLGEILAGPLYGEAGVLSVELDLDMIIKAKLDFDPIGHYNRSDIFNFSING